MNTGDPWKNLSASLRARGRDAGPLPDGAPFGFHSRVLARARDPRGLTADTWLRLALRALPIGATVLAICWLMLPGPGAAPSESDLGDLVFLEELQ
jgi:hypothetical protein